MSAHALTGYIKGQDGEAFVGRLIFTLLRYPDTDNEGIVSGRETVIDILEEHNGQITGCTLVAGDYSVVWRDGKKTNTAFFAMPNGDADLADLVVVDDEFPSEIWRHFDRTLIAWTQGGAYQLTNATANPDGVITSASITWPDTFGGALAVSVVDPEFHVANAYTVTHVRSGKTVIQDTVTRDVNGAISNQPLLRVEPPGDVMDADSPLSIGGWGFYSTLDLFRASGTGETHVWLLADLDGARGFFYRGGSGTDDGVNFVVRSDGMVFTRFL